MQKTVVITGVSSGIGEAAVRLFTKEGWNVIGGARRVDRLEELALETGATMYELDITDDTSVKNFCTQIENCDALINNAGGAFGLERVVDASLENWAAMYEVNVLGTARMTQALFDQLLASGDGQIINVCSIASVVTYEGGGGYTAAKHAERALTQTLRKELLGLPIRVSEIDPGKAETEFSIVRFDGDEERAAAEYKGMTALNAEDIAEAILWVASRPSYVNVDSLQLTPRDQIAGYKIHRQSDNDLVDVTEQPEVKVQ